MIRMSLGALWLVAGLGLAPAAWAEQFELFACPGSVYEAAAVWEGEAHAAEAPPCPDHCSCGTSNSALNATGKNEWLHASEFCPFFVLPAGQTITDVFINVMGKYPVDCDGRVRLVAKVPGLATDPDPLSDPEDSTTCHWFFPGLGHHINQTPAGGWTADVINGMTLRVQKYASPTYCPNLRIMAFRIVVVTCADCDGDGVCDEEDEDDDNDWVYDEDDPQPCNRWVCGDEDGDGCDDCGQVGYYDPDHDGPDCDGDGECDASDVDDDEDGVPDVLDPAPCNKWVCGSWDGDACDDCSVLGYQDGYFDGPDFDGDGLCDVSNLDDDEDGVPDTLDPFPHDQYKCGSKDGDSCDDCASGYFAPDDDGPDCDWDWLCDASDPDDDNDGVPDALDPVDCNPFVCGDADHDGCDDCGLTGYYAPDEDGPDQDYDGICAAGDNCPDEYNPDQQDTDGDGIGDACDESTPGDLNCDGLLDAFDIDPFVLVLTSGPDYQEYYDEYPDCDAALGDINQDGKIDAFDVDPFIALLTKAP